MSTKKKFEEVSIECILKISYDIWDRSMEEYKKTMNECNNITYKDAMKYRYYHSKLTGDIALKLYRKYIINKDNRDERILYLSALTHDIKKIDKKHIQAGADWIRNNIGDFFEISDDDIEKVALLVRYHKSSVKKIEHIQDKNILDLILILQIADSLSKFREKSVYKEIDHDKLKKKLIEVIESFNK